MQVLRERLRQPVGERLHHDGVVVVVVRFVTAHQVVHPEARGNRKGADVVAPAGVAGRDVVGERTVRPVVAGRLLLAQHVEPDQLRVRRRRGAAGRRLPKNDVVPFRRGGPEAVDAPRGQAAVADDLPQ